MKRILIIIALLGVLMFVTNPTKDQFEEYYSTKIEKIIEHETQKEDNLLKKFGSIFSNRSAQASAMATLERKEYFLFSTYSVNIFGADENYIGVFKFFFRISDSIEKQLNDASKDLNKEVEKLEKDIKDKLEK